MDTASDYARAQLIAEIFGWSEELQEQVACPWRPPEQRRERAHPKYYANGSVAPSNGRYYQGGDIPQGMVLRVLPAQRRPRYSTMRRAA